MAFELNTLIRSSTCNFLNCTISVDGDADVSDVRILLAIFRRREMLNVRRPASLANATKAASIIAATAGKRYLRNVCVFTINRTQQRFEMYGPIMRELASKLGF
jgi:hypothetical protein